MFLHRRDGRMVRAAQIEIDDISLRNAVHPQFFGMGGQFQHVLLALIDPFQPVMAFFQFGKLRLQRGNGHIRFIDADIAEQDQIASAFNQVEELISLRKQQLAKLDELVKARFVELFGEPLDLLDSGKTIPLDKAFSRITVGFVGEAASSYVEVGIPYLRTQNVRKGYIDFSGLIYVSEEFHNTNQKSKIKPGDIVVSRVGVNRGMAAVIPQELEEANIANCLIISKEDSVNSTYLAYYLNMSYGLSPKFGASVGSAQGVINTAILKKWEVFLPPFAQQEQFAAFVEQTDKSKLAIQQSLDKLETLKKALMQKYFG